MRAGVECAAWVRVREHVRVQVTEWIRVRVRVGVLVWIGVWV